MEDHYNLPHFLETHSYVKEGYPSKPSSPPPWPSNACRDENASELRLGHHYLDACFRCGKLLGRNRDIFMYRGDMPVCSEECRQRQIDADEAREERSKHPAAREREQQRHSSIPQRIPIWAHELITP